MRNILRVFMPLIAIMVFVNLYFVRPDGIKPVGNYPVWMKDSSGNRADQTSGLCFLGEVDGKKILLDADDIGKINRLTIDESLNPPRLEIKEILYSDEVNSLFQKFKKKDIEDIFYDKPGNRILLTLEGHEYSSFDPEIYKQKEGIYELTFNKDIFTFDSILTIKRMKLPKQIYAHTYDNIGFEGFFATENYFFLGLENLQTNGTQFSDSTILYILNRKTNEVKEIGTSDLGINTISALYASDDYNVYGVDRNSRGLFYIKFNEDFTVNNYETAEMDLGIPLHSEINNIVGMAPESITFDNERNIYVAVDPWMDMYKPDLTDKKKLSPEELENFHIGIPILYKFRNPFK